MEREGDATLSEGSIAENTITLRKNREILVNCPKTTRKGSSGNVMPPTAQMKCLYTNICSMGNRQELETLVQLDKYDLITVMDTW